MPDQKEQLESFLQFIRERRSNESHFDELYNKLDETIATLDKDQKVNDQFINSLKEVKDKQAEEYMQAKEKGTEAWPEFEKFITQLERAATGELKDA
jgi:uncharacterized protein YdcH (DUF465 family)